MKEKNDSGTVKMNLSLPRSFAKLLQQNADKCYMPLATWVKSYLMKNLINAGDNEENSMNEHEIRMEKQ